MGIYRKEDEQIYRIKHLFSRTAKMLFIGTILVVALLTLYYWRNYRDCKLHDLSVAYETIISEIRIDQPQTLVAAERFIVKNKNTYGALVALKIAQLYVDKNALDKAANQLQKGATLISDDNLKSLINLRLARVQLQQKKEDDALKTLNIIQNEGFSAIVTDLRGEALLGKGDKEGARKMWKAGVNRNISPTLSEIMQMKINNLSM